MVTLMMMVTFLLYNILSTPIDRCQLCVIIEMSSCTAPCGPIILLFIIEMLPCGRQFELLFATRALSAHNNSIPRALLQCIQGMQHLSVAHKINYSVFVTTGRVSLCCDSHGFLLLCSVSLPPPNVTDSIENLPASE